MKWINFLHIYQPPTQSGLTVSKIARESYDLIVGLLERYSSLKLTMNVSGCLLEMLEANGRADVVEALKKHALAGRIEFVGSAMYHPIMPLMSAEECRRQIGGHNDACKRYFGEAYHPRGFYLPEMAYSAAAARAVAARTVKEAGFEWLILDQIHAGRPIDPTVKYEIEGVGLRAVFRDSRISKSFPPEMIVRELDSLRGRTVITAHDGELYGHWHTDDRGFYEKAFSNPDIKMETVSEYLDGLRKDEIIAVRDASWESTEDELKAGVPFALWDDPKNEVHQKLWALAHLSEQTVTAHPDDAYIGTAHTFLDKGFASCAWWWGSGRKIGPFSPISWNPTEVEKGARLLLEAVRSLKVLSRDERLQAENAFSALRDLVWKKHWE